MTVTHSSLTMCYYYIKFKIIINIQCNVLTKTAKVLLVIHTCAQCTFHRTFQVYTGGEDKEMIDLMRMHMYKAAHRPTRPRPPP